MDLNTGLLIIDIIATGLSFTVLYTKLVERVKALEVTQKFILEKLKIL